MRFSLHVPQLPERSPQLAATLVIYVRETVAWESKQLVRDLEQEEMADEEVLNRLSAKWWELAAAFVHAGRVHYLFKSVVG